MFFKYIGPYILVGSCRSIPMTGCNSHVAVQIFHLLSQIRNQFRICQWIAFFFPIVCFATNLPDVTICHHDVVMLLSDRLHSTGSFFKILWGKVCLPYETMQCQFRILETVGTGNQPNQTH
jgi:hypothetical protein